MDTQVIWWKCLAVLMCCAGCRLPGSVTTQEPNSSMDWQPERFRQHIAYLNGNAIEGRQTASLGFARAAGYAASRFREGGLQPVLGDEFRMQVAGRVAVTTGARFSLVTPADTLELTWGRHFLVDARSGSGLWEGALNSDSLVSTKGPELPDTQGARLILFRNASLPGTRVSNPDAPMVVRILDQAPERVLRLLDEGPPDTRVEVSVSRETSISTGIIHVGALLPGADPNYRDSLIVMVSALDGFGIQGEMQWTDGTDTGMGAVALLEAAVRTADVQQNWSHIRSSMLFGLISDTRNGCEGPDSFSRRIPWLPDRVRHVIWVVGSAPEGPACSWDTLRPLLKTAFPNAEIMQLADEPAELPSELRIRSELMDAARLERSQDQSMRLAESLTELTIQLDRR